MQDSQGDGTGSVGGGGQSSHQGGGGSSGATSGGGSTRQEAQNTVDRGGDTVQRSQGGGGFDDNNNNNNTPEQQNNDNDNNAEDPAYRAHKVQEGECITSISKDNGLHWETLWNDPKNDELKQLRKDPNVIFPGDVVYIRKRTKKYEACAAEQLHRFRALGQPAMCRLQILNDDQPRANEQYKFEVGDRTYEGTTDAEGKLEHPVPNQARSAKVTIGPDQESQDVYTLSLGSMDPVGEIKGAQKRLLNLGFYPGAFDGQLGPKTESSLLAFQRKHELTETGQLDSETATLLVEKHGS